MLVSSPSPSPSPLPTSSFSPSSPPSSLCEDSDVREDYKTYKNLLGKSVLRKSGYPVWLQTSQKDGGYGY